MTESVTEQAKTLTIYRMYTKTCLFKMADTLEMTGALLENPPMPVIDTKIAANYQARDNDTYEAVLTIQLTAKVNDSALWSLDLQYAGLYVLKGFAQAELDQILYGHCMNQMYPHAYAVITQMVTQAGFKPIYAAPMDFVALYHQQKAQEKSANSTTMTH